jgi:hypothetical protein
MNTYTSWSRTIYYAFEISITIKVMSQSLCSKVRQTKIEHPMTARFINIWQHENDKFEPDEQAV